MSGENGQPYLAISCQDSSCQNFRKIAKAAFFIQVNKPTEDLVLDLNYFYYIITFIIYSRNFKNLGSLMYKQLVTMTSTLTYT